MRRFGIALILGRDKNSLNLTLWNPIRAQMNIPI